MQYFFYIICLLAFSFGNAQSLYTNYNVKWIDAEDGLNQISVRNCVQDDNGFLWIATELGLFKYDGNKILKDNYIYSAFNNKRIFSIVKDYNTEIIYFITHPDLKTYSIRNGIIKEETEIYKKGFFQYNFSFFNKNHQNFSRIFNSIKNSSLFFPSENILQSSSLETSDFFYFADKDYIGCIDSKGVETKIVQSNTNGYDFLKFGNTVIGLGKNKIDLFKNNQIIDTNIICDEIIKNYCFTQKIYHYHPLYHSNNKYFINILGNLYEILYENKRLYTKFLFKCPSNDIRSLYYSKNEETFYLSSATKGVAILKPKKINVFTIGHEIFDCNYVVLEKNKIWYSYKWKYNRFTNKYKINNFNTFNENFGFLLFYKNNIYFEGKNNRLISIEDGISSAPLKTNKKLNYLTSYTYLNNKLWISSDRNIGYIIGDSMVLDKTLEKFSTSYRRIHTISNFNDNLIIGTTKGVYTYNPKNKKLYVIPKLENVTARYIKKIDPNSFWVGCYGDGLYIVKKNKAYKVVDKNINLNTAHAIEEDKKGNLWISTNNGLLTIDKKTIIYNTLHKMPIECYKFTTVDGLLTNEFNGGGIHRSLKTNDGIIGFPSMKGFVWFDPEKLKKNLFSGTIIIDKIILDNKEIATFKNGVYHINKLTKILKLDFSYGYDYNRENLTISYRFEDQSNWTEITGNSFQFGRHKKGKHKLFIKISTHGFSSTKTVYKVVNLDFEPKFYELKWFWGLIIIAVVFILFLTYKTGNYFSRKRELYLKEKIKEKTKELEISILDLEKSKESLDKTLQLKNILLKEIHHRVKNNLQLVMSLLNIQSRKINNKEINDFIEKSQARINTMALIHQNLYNTENLNKVDFYDYLNQLQNAIISTHPNKTDKIKFDITTNDLFFEIQTAIPLGLILNELISNSLKYAFPNEKDIGQIKISIKKEEKGIYSLNYEDNGIGYSESEIKNSSIGLTLISILTQQLEGEIYHTNENGTKYKITFTEVIQNRIS